MAWNSTDLYYAQRGSGPGATRGLVSGNDLRLAAEFPLGTKTIFYQAAAPVYWTQDTSYNNQQLRIVRTASTGGSTGGSISVPVFYSGAVTAGTTGQVNSGTVNPTTLTIATMPSHSHGTSPMAGCGGNSNGGGVTFIYCASFPSTGSAGGDGSHTHTFTLPAPYTVNSFLPWSVKYASAIVCTKSS